MLPALLFALKLVWPPHVEHSTAGGCQVSRMASDNPSPHLAHYWQAWGIIKWAEAGPDGDDVMARVSLVATDSRKKALLACNDFLEGYDKLMGAYVRGQAK